MTLVDTDRAGTDRRRRGAVLRLVAAAALVLGWVVHLLASFVGGYEEVPWVTLEQEQHRVTAVSVVASVPAAPSTWWSLAAPGDSLSAAPDGLQGQVWRVVYTVADGQRVRVADPHYGSFGPPSTTHGASSAADGQELRDALLARELPAVGAEDVPEAWRLTQVSGVVLALATLLLVVAGPRPVHGNRWFWFWLVQLPAGLGVLAYACYELGGRGHDRAVASPGRREGGGWGFVRLVSGHVVIGVATALAAMLLGTTVTPL